MTRPSGFALAALARGLGALGALSALGGCNVHSYEHALMVSAYRPSARLEAPAPYRMLAGDMHCHVSPPDDPTDVGRDVPETVAIARDEGLDFVVFTPHLPARFFADAREREAASAGFRELRRAIAASRGPDSPILVAGFEYTDDRFGHVGASFADLDAVLADVPLAQAAAQPASFFERWVAHGGLLVVNHPVVTPLDSILRRARGDMSWRPWTAKDGPLPPEIAAIHRLAFGFEAYNAAVTQMRDRLFVGDASSSVREVMSRLDLEIQTSQRALTPVGGSDSHASYLRAAMFALATGKSEQALREALVHGRTCVLRPEPCTLEARSLGHPWVQVGDALDAIGDVEVRVRSEEPVTILRDGGVALTLPRGGAAHVPVDGVCNVIRARVGDGFSGGIYVNCEGLTSAGRLASR